MASTSSTATRQQKFDVFLSFRGADTRDGFVSHLYDALRRNQIETFIDNRLEGGEKISPALLEKIEKSDISVVVFSENYADSPWCLEELAKILECKETLGQMVLPVFYKVDPTHVQELSDSYGDALAEHQRKSSPEKVNGWRRALTEIANLKGWDSNKIKPETKLIEEIVHDIWSKLYAETSSDFHGLFGIGSRIKEVESLLCVGAPDVRIVGIWGMGGIGKTTLAEVIYNKISAQFEGRFFLPNIRQELERSTTVALRNKILSEILGKDVMSIGTLNSLPMSIKRMLQRKKVLIVLDDVSSPQQLKALVGEDGLLGHGSRVLVTSRDMQVLKNRCHQIYKVKELEDNEAVQLCRLHAFQQQICPTEEDVELSQRMVKYAKGIPLALKVLGANLYGKNAEEWKSEFQKLQETLDMEIQNILKISYDGLEPTEKSIFLDIACFFGTCSKDRVQEIFDRCGFFATRGLGRLSDKCLIDISEGGIRMHDLLQKLGRDIVCLECIDPRKRSRLWIPDDICHVLTHYKGSETVEAISLDMSKIRQLKLSGTVFQKMCNLRLLEFYGRSEENRIIFPEGLEFLSNNLRVLHWEQYPLKSLPSNFCPKYLVELRMPESRLTNLSGFPRLENLKLIDLRECKNLVEVPPFDGDCSKLRKLKLHSCVNLRCLPSLLHLTSLESVNLAGCAKIEEFPGVPLNIQTLNLSGTAIKQVPSSIGHLSQLSKLDLTECKRLESVHSNIGQLKRLGRLSVSRSEINDVICDSPATLVFYGCENLSDHQLEAVGRNISIRNILSSLTGHLGSLHELRLKGCGISEIPDTLGSLVSLLTLDLSRNDFKSIPTSIKQLSNLQTLTLRECRRLQRLPELPWRIDRLEVLQCSSLRSIMLNPPLEHLKWMDLSWCENLVEVILPELTSLRYLWIHNCSSLRSIILNALEHLIDMDLRYCVNLRCLPSLLHLTSLEFLYLAGCAKLEEFPEVPLNIKTLNLSGTAIKQVPSSIGHLSQLSQLDLTECKRLQSIHSSIGQLKHLGRLRVSGGEMHDVGSDSPATLVFDGCENLPDHQLKDLRSTVGHHISIRNILSSLTSHVESLYNLCLVGCGISKIPNTLGSLVSLSTLDLSRNDFKIIPASIKQLSNLESLYLTECRRLQCLTELPSRIQRLGVSHCSSLRSIVLNPLKHLREMDLRYCVNLRCLPSLLHLTSLESFDLGGCAKLEELPEVPLNIQTLNLSGTAIKQVPSSIGHLSRLFELYLADCKRLESVHSNIGQLKRLGRLVVSRREIDDVIPYGSSELVFYGCENLSDHQLEDLESPVGLRNILSSLTSHLGSLYLLKIDNCGISEIPDTLGYLVSLSTLDLSRNDFKSIPASIKQLSNLSDLYLRECRRLQCLPELPSRLEELDVSHCSSLKSVRGTLPGSLKSSRFDHCYCLDENSRFQIMADLQSTMPRYATEIDSLWSELFFCIPGNEVPEWFSYKNTEGSSFQKIKRPRSYNNNRLLGFTVCAIVAPKELQIFEHDRGNHGFFSVSCDYHLITESGCYNLHLDINGVIERIDKPHVFIWCNSLKSFDYFFETSFTLDLRRTTTSGLLKGLQVSKCGVLPLLTQDDGVEVGDGCGKVDNEIDEQPCSKRLKFKL